MGASDPVDLSPSETVQPADQFSVYGNLGYRDLPQKYFFVAGDDIFGSRKEEPIELSR